MTWIYQMRFAEALSLVFYTFFILLACFRSLSWKRRFLVWAIGGLGLGLVYFSQTMPNRVREWLPLMLLLLAYWQPGAFLVHPNQRWQDFLERTDERILGSLRRFPVWVNAYLEGAYLFCYPFLPIAFGIHVFLASGKPEEFWRITLPPSYFCYAMVPFIRLLPPWRMMPEIEPNRMKIRSLNFFILRYASTRANTFPSAHMAASLAASLVLLQNHPWFGAAALWVSLSIGVSAFTGRYHYAIDVLLGAVLALLSAYLF